MRREVELEAEDRREGPVMLLPEVVAADVTLASLKRPSIGFIKWCHQLISNEDSFNPEGAHWAAGDEFSEKRKKWKKGKIEIFTPHLSVV